MPILIEGKGINNLLKITYLFIYEIERKSTTYLVTGDVNSVMEHNNYLLAKNQELYGISYENLMDEKPDEQLKSLLTQVCRHPPRSQERQKLLTQIIRLTSKKLWWEKTPYYQDALQQTWLYFCRNICESLTYQTYNPTDGSVITWLNAYLKRRLQDFYLNQHPEQVTIVSPKYHQSISSDISKIIGPIDNLPPTPQTPCILENLQIWVNTDSDGELRHTHIKERPDVNCQVLILKRLPPEVSWRELSEEFGLPIPTLSSFYQGECLPRLRSFAKLKDLL